MMEADLNDPFDLGEAEASTPSQWLSYGQFLEDVWPRLKSPTRGIGKMLATLANICLITGNQGSRTPH